MYFSPPFAVLQIGYPFCNQRVLLSWVLALEYWAAECPSHPLTGTGHGLGKSVVLIWEFLKMGDPQVTMGFNSKMVLF